MSKAARPVFLHPSKLHNRIAGIVPGPAAGRSGPELLVHPGQHRRQRPRRHPDRARHRREGAAAPDRSERRQPDASDPRAGGRLRFSLSGGQRRPPRPWNSALLPDHHERIHADLALFTDPDFVLQASTTGQADRFLAAVSARPIRPSPAASQARQIEIIGGEPFQIVAVPVHAPVLIGWVGMGFRVDETKLQDIRSLSGLEVTLLRPAHLRAPRSPCPP